MATIRKRNGVWQAQVRRRGQPSLTRTFRSRADARDWARQVETDIDRRGIAPRYAELEHITLADLLRRYRDEVVVHKRSRVREEQYIRVLLRHRIAAFSLGHITPDEIRAFRDERLRSVKASTLCRQLAILQHAFNVAIKEWNLPLPSNPVAMVSKPSIVRQRDRRLRPGELEHILAACGTRRVWWLDPIVQLAVETGMRRGEILRIEREHIDLEAGTLWIPVTKNGFGRTIPLTSQAAAILSAMTAQSGDGRLFPISANAFRLAWERLKRRAEVRDLRFHDLRHEAISRFFEMGLSLPEVALISGHRDPRMLFRYTHVAAGVVSAKLRMVETQGNEAGSIKLSD